MMTRRGVLGLLSGGAAGALCGVRPAEAVERPQLDKTLIGYYECRSPFACKGKVFSFVRGTTPCCPKCGWAHEVTLGYYRLMASDKPTPVLTEALYNELRAKEQR